MVTIPRPESIPFEERVKKLLPFDWGYGSTLRTNKLRDKLYWKASVTCKEMQDAAGGVPTCTFRKGVRIDMDRARIVTQAFRETEGQPIVLQFARMVEKLCDEMPILIKDGELIVGDANGGADRVRWYPEINVEWMPEAVTKGGFSTIVTDDEKREILEDICPFWKDRATASLIKSALPKDLAPTILAHGTFIMNVWEQGMVLPSLDWKVLFQEGLTARIKFAEDKLEELERNVLSTNPAEYLEKRNNWQAMARCGKAIIRYAKRHSELARQQAAGEKDHGRKQELENLAEILERVPANPPRTFQECLQFYWIIDITTHYLARWGFGSGARIDQVWWPYYEADRKAERISREDAVELIECLFLKIQELGAPLAWPPEFAGTSGACTVYTADICGTTADGRDASNDLSCIIMEALANLHLTQPPVALRYHPNIDPKVIETAINLNRSGLGHPSYFNERLLEKWGELRGWSPEDVKKVQVCGCTAPHVMGKGVLTTGVDYVAVMTLPIVLDEVLRSNHLPKSAGTITFKTGKNAVEMRSVDELIEAFMNRIRYYTQIALVSWNTAQQVTLEHRADPSVSLLMDDTLQRGIDLLRLHKEHDTWPALVPFGAINVADSLTAIRKLVFEERKYTMQQLLTALDSTWIGHDVMRQDFLNAPKYGNDEDYADEQVTKVFTKLNETLCEFKDAWGYTCCMDGSTATGYVLLGLMVPASPDGRQVCAPLGDGTMSPMAGMDTNGPTAVLNSGGKIPYNHPQLLNQRFMANFLEGSNRDLFAQYLRAWYEKDIPHVQFNVVNSQVLREAQAKPEAYSDLMVRVAGYSAYFVDLASYVQDSIIARTEQAL